MNRFTLGKIAGAAGITVVVAALVTWLLTRSGYLTFAQLAFGLALLAVFVITNWERMNQFATKKSSVFFFTSVAMTAALLISLVALNYIAAKKGASWDLTHKKVNSLAPQTQNALASLPEKVSAIAFLPAADPAYDPLEALLKRYQQQSPEKFEYTFRDPRKNPDLVARYKLQPNQSSVVLTRGEGANQTQRTLNILSEQELTNALINLSSVGQQKVCVLAGHGEWPLEASEERANVSLSKLKQSLAQEGYVTEPLSLVGRPEVPRDCALTVLAGGQDPFTEAERAVLEHYLDEGGRLAYFAEVKSEPGLDSLLSRYGVQVDNGVVADLKYKSDSPYYVVSLFFGDHEIVRQLKELNSNLIFPGVRGLSVVRAGTAEGVTPTVLVTTSPDAWEESTPNSDPRPSDGEKLGKIPLVIASTRNTANAANKRSDEARLVVFGDSELLVNANWGVDANRNLVLNAFGWATNQGSKVTIRPPDRDLSTIDIDEQMMASLQFLSLEVVPVSMLILGLAI